MNTQFLVTRIFLNATTHRQSRVITKKTNAKTRRKEKTQTHSGNINPASNKIYRSPCPINMQFIPISPNPPNGRIFNGGSSTRSSTAGNAFSAAYSSVCPRCCFPSLCLRTPPRPRPRPRPRPPRPPPLRPPRPFPLAPLRPPLGEFARRAPPGPSARGTSADDARRGVRDRLRSGRTPRMPPTHARDATADIRGDM